MTKGGQVLRRKVLHTTLGCSHLTQWKNVLPQPAIHQNSTTHITVSKDHQIQAGLTQQKLIEVLNKVKNHMQEFKTDFIEEKKEKKNLISGL